MKSDRLIRVNELIRREIAANLHRFAHGSDVDLAAVTITRVSAASNLRTARVWVSVLGDHQNSLAGGESIHRVLTLLLERRREIQAHLGHTLRLKYTPRLFFQMDGSLEQGDRVLALLSSLPIVEDDDTDTDESPPPDGTGGAE